MRNHIVICGFNSKLEKILSEISKSELARYKVVLISEKIPNLQKNQKFKTFYINGNPTDEKYLRLANISSARGVIVLSDNYSQESIEKSNYDAKSLLISMAIRKINPDIYICAEILDRNNERLFHAVNVDEVVYIQEYFNRLVTQAISVKGIGKFYRLLSKSGANFGTVYKCDIPEAFRSKQLTHEEIRKKIIMETEGIQLIGIEVNERCMPFSKNRLCGFLSVNPPKIKSETEIIDASYIPGPKDKLLVISNKKPELERMFAA